MKFVKYLFLIVILHSCKAQTNLKTMIINYDATTRGSSIKFEVTSTKVYYKDIEKTIETKTNSKFWKEITTIVEQINLTEIESFSSPTSNRNVDAALHATLSISINDLIYESQTFDHGNPPDKLKPLIEVLFKVLE
ncbi:MAG: hypothetical protein GQ540_01085 [Lutibacter sp.]|uniref:hypothetical protein n=1 Tax=Lutibacter sp. TaxID=1925666 RepID=UPI0019E5A3A0|nr:hypothetical protein [Lutibacter sp.]NOR27103.1 hypothetical protein [Lutibacter sp.]